MTPTLTSTRTYRVVKLTTIGTAEPIDSVVWHGTSTKLLSRQYPPSQIFGADPLGHSEIEGGHIQIDYRFEELKDGTWQEIPDPRVRLTPLTALEREIDAENRRLFPGDFSDEDEEYPEYDGDYDPYDCEQCQDRGCTICEPTPTLCFWCKKVPVAAEYELCAACEAEIDANYPKG